MTRENLRKGIENLNSKNATIVVTIPENGDEMEVFSVIKPIEARLINEGRPLRITTPIAGSIISYTFGEITKLLTSEEYFEKFYSLATQFGEVEDLFVFTK